MFFQCPQLMQQFQVRINDFPLLIALNAIMLSNKVLGQKKIKLKIQRENLEDNSLNIVQNRKNGKQAGILWQRKE